MSDAVTINTVTTKFSTDDGGHIDITPTNDIKFTLKLFPGRKYDFQGNSTTTSTNGSESWTTGFWPFLSHHSDNYDFDFYEVYLSSNIELMYYSYTTTTQIFSEYFFGLSTEKSNVPYTQKFPPGLYSLGTKGTYRTPRGYRNYRGKLYKSVVAIPPILDAFEMRGPNNFNKTNSYYYTVYANFWGRDTPRVLFYSDEPYYSIDIDYSIYTLSVFFIVANTNVEYQVDVEMSTFGNTSMGTLYLPSGLNPYTPIYLRARPKYNYQNNVAYETRLRELGNGSIYVPLAYLTRTGNPEVYSVSLTQTINPIVLFDQTRHITFKDTQLYVKPYGNTLQLVHSITYDSIFQGSYTFNSGFFFVPNNQVNEYNVSNIAIQRFLTTNNITTLPLVSYSYRFNQSSKSTITNQDTTTITRSSFVQFDSIPHPTELVYILTDTNDSIQLEDYMLVYFVKMTDSTGSSTIFFNNVELTDILKDEHDIEYNIEKESILVSTLYKINPSLLDITKEFISNDLLHTTVSIDNQKQGQSQLVNTYSPEINTHTFTNIGSYFDITYRNKVEEFVYIQNNRVNVTAFSKLQIGDLTEDSHFFLKTNPIITTLSNLLFDPSFNISTIHNHPFLKKVDFTYKLETYMDTLTFELLAGLKSITSTTISPNNQIINFNTGENTAYSITLDYSSNSFSGEDLQIHYTATNTVGSNSKQITGDKDIGDEFNAFPHLVSVDFIEITTIQYEFDISKDFFDDVINDTTHEGAFSFKPFNQTVAFKDVSKTVNGASYRITQEFPNQSLVNNMAYSFSVNTVLHGDTTDYSSNSISKTLVLPTPSFEIESLPDTRGGIYNSILVKNLGYADEIFNTLVPEDITYTIQTKVPEYSGTQIPPYTFDGTNTDISLIYYFEDSVDVVVEFQYNGVDGSTSHTETKDTLNIVPFGIDSMDIKSTTPNNEKVEITVEIYTYGPLDSYVLELIDVTDNFAFEPIVIAYSGDDPTQYIKSLADIEDVTTTIQRFRLEHTVEIDSGFSLDNFQLRANTRYRDVDSLVSQVSVKFTFSEIISITSFLSNDAYPSFIDISFDIGNFNSVWKQEQNKGFVEIYEYRSASSFVIGEIPKESFTNIKRCQLYNAPEETKVIQSVAGKDNEYIINTFLEDRELINGWYYGYYLSIGLFNELGHELTRIDDTVRTFLHVDVIGNITSISAFISNPAFIDISFDVGENNEAWKLEQNKGFVDIYEYRSASSFVIGDIPKESFTKIKRCELITTNDITKIQGVEGKDNEYVVNTYLTNRKIVYGWYYGYYLNIGLINEVNSELIRIDDTVRSFAHVDYPLPNTYDFVFTSTIGNGFIGSGEHTIPILRYMFTPNPVPSVPFYNFDHNDLVYTTTYDHRGTSNVRSIVYTTESNPSTSLGEFPTDIGELEYVDDTSLVQVSITMNYRINGIHDDISNIPTSVQDVDTLIEPKPVTDLNVQKTITDNISGIHIQWNHTGIVEDFLVSIVDVTINPPVVDAGYVFSGRYVIGTDDYETTYTYAFDISYGRELLDKEISFNVTPRFYGVNGETVSEKMSFVFEAVDISFIVNYPTLITFDFSINGIQQEQATSNIAVLIGVSDNDIPNPLRIDENDVFALFRNPEDTEPTKRLLQTFYPYPQPDASNVLTSGRMLDLSYGFGVPLDPGKYYYFTVCPVVDVPERGGLFISPPSNVAKIQLRDISGIDISLVFHQSYAQDYTLGGTDFSANTELARFGITDPTNILEIKYTLWNGWAENLVIHVAENGELDFRQIDNSYTIPVRQVYTALDFEADTEAPRYQGFEIQEIYSYEDLILQGDYFSEPLFFLRSSSGIQKLIDISNIHTDVSNTYYTLSDHVLVRHVDTPNISVEIIQEIDQFGTNTVAEETIPTPVRPNDISLGQFYAHNLWTVDTTRRLHIYLQNYDVGGLDLNELEFRVTVFDTSPGELGGYLKWTEDSGVVFNEYRITIDSIISFTVDGFTEDGIPVFAFDVSYDGEEETDNVDISIVAVYYGVKSDTVVRELTLLSTKPVVDVSSIPNPTINPTQDPKEIAIDLSFSATEPVLAVNMRVFVSDISIVNYENSGVLPDASFSDWVSVSGERLTRTGDHTFGFTTYNPTQGLREFTWMYFQFQGVYGRTTTSWSDTYEFVIDKLLERPTIDLSFVGYRLPYFAIDLPDFIRQVDIKDIYPYNKLTVSIEDISYVTSYTFDFHYTNNVFERIVEVLPYTNFYTMDSLASIDITANYENIQLDQTSTQNVRIDTPIVPTINTGEVDLGTGTNGNILIGWNPIPFSKGYRIYRSVYESPVMEPNDVSFQLIATTSNPSLGKYYDTRIRTNSGAFLRFNPYVYYAVQAIYDISGETVYSELSPIVYFAFDIGCVCPLSSPVLRFNSSGVTRQISNRRRIAQKLATGRKYF